MNWKILTGGEMTPKEIAEEIANKKTISAVDVVTWKQKIKEYIRSITQEAVEEELSKAPRDEKLRTLQYNVAKSIKEKIIRKVNEDT